MLIVVQILLVAAVVGIVFYLAYTKKKSQASTSNPPDFFTWKTNSTSKGSVQIIFDPEKMVLEMNSTDENKQVSTKKIPFNQLEDYQALYKVLTDHGLWDLKKDYTSPKGVENKHWNLKVRWDARHITANGINNFPKGLSSLENYLMLIFENSK